MRRGPLTLDAARRTVRERVACRNEIFLSLVERGTYGWPGRLYLALLKHAGCELGDRRAHVRGAGLEEISRQ